MSEKVCVIIGASHAGVNFAFSLRKEGFEGKIIMYDKDPVLPYHRPPLSKAYLTADTSIEDNCLKSKDSYLDENITLNLGVEVIDIHKESQKIILNNGEEQHYNYLILATGARPIIPPISGLKEAKHVYPLRTAGDVSNIKKWISTADSKRVVVIGGGYIGLETAASLKKMGTHVVVLEREERILARVTAPVMSEFFQKLHTDKDVDILTSKNVESINTDEEGVNTVQCSDGSSYAADMIIVGVGVNVNVSLAKKLNLEIENGIKVNEYTQTSLQNVYAIGDNTYHYNPHYKNWIRLESVQNAVDQAKVTAAHIVGNEKIYDTIPWFWSDQYDVKLQMVGLSQGYEELIVRKEETESIKFSVWYFKGDELLAVDAINNAKAYVIGTKFIKENKVIDKDKLKDVTTIFKPANLMMKEEV
ncbi:NAD(P)/FAD-dependent oxidoreductase [Flammeovirga pacifica]|uniref:Pyridine nucleotide-disulfide oxidoreductase n=1 Tax=Flammeovirga pacifica TaxID=915059 RepID=A0A1S1YZA0_FLAPC|nr:FAD/NAD(P)-binding oxidoreductase [Flammeovirga pacifica]OHX66341.1 pyridine nucleotide-disulfide oxidoreductase [Flammeovirga pacifica]